MCALFSPSGLELAFHLYHNINQVHLTSTSQTSMMYQNCVQDTDPGGHPSKTLPARGRNGHGKEDCNPTLPGWAEVVRTSLVPHSVYAEHSLAA